MSEVPSPGPPVQVTVADSASQILFSDVVVINGSPMGFVLNFGQWAPEQAGMIRVYSRIGMSPQHMKALARLLDQNVKGFEKQFGEIMLSDQPQPPHQHIGFQPQDRAR